MSNDWLPFVESVQKKNSDIIYATLFGGNILEVSNEKCRYIYRNASQKESFAPIHFSIYFENKKFFFNNKNEVIIIENGKCCVEIINNNLEELYVPFVYDNSLEIIGCNSTKRFAWTGKRFEFCDTLGEKGNWWTRRVTYNSYYINLWNNDKHEILMFDIKKKKASFIKVDVPVINEVIEVNGALYIADTIGNMYVYDLKYHKMVKKVKNICNNSIQLIVSYKGNIYCFCDKGNNVYITNAYNSIKKISIQAESNSNIHWTRLSNELIFGIVEDEEFDEAYILQFDLLINSDKIYNFKKMFYDSELGKKEYSIIVPESNFYSVKDFLKKI